MEILMHLRIENDGNIAKYISILRKYTDKTIQELKTAIELFESVYTCDYFDLNALIRIKELYNLLVSSGAKVHLFEDSKPMTYQLLKNLIETYKGIAEDTSRFIDLEVEAREKAERERQ